MLADLYIHSQKATFLKANNNKFLHYECVFDGTFQESTSLGRERGGYIRQLDEIGDMPGLSMVRWAQNWDGDSWPGLT